MEPIVKQPVVVETKAGAGGQVGAQVVRQRQAGRLHAAVAQYRHFRLRGGRQVVRTPGENDRAPISFRWRGIVADPVVLLVNDQQPYKTAKEFIDDAKKRPDTLVFSSGGLYGATHLPLALLDKAAGSLEASSSADQWRRTGDYRYSRQQRADAPPNRSPPRSRISRPASCARSRCSARPAPKQLPDVPTLKELGYDTEYYLWVGIFAPKATPAPIVLTLRDAIKKAAHSDQFKTALKNAGQELAYLDGPDFQKFWDIDGKRTDEAVLTIGRVQG